MKRFVGFFFLSFIFLNCQKENPTKPDTLFTLISPDSSGVHFENTITTNDSINILAYEYLYNGGGVGIGDFDNDSLPDIFFTGNMVPCRLYHNKGNFKFDDITTSSGIDTKGIWAYGVSVIDINQDGWQDIYLCAGGMGNKDAFPNKLFINQGNLTFKESAKEYGLDDAGESIQSAFMDYDNDGDLDMYLLTGGGFEKSAIVPRPIINDGSARNTDRLYRNDYDASLTHPFFTNVSQAAGIIEEGFGLGVSVLDINEDGWPDVYVTNDYLSNDLLYVNNHNGTFSEKSDKYFKHTSHFAMGNDVGDINNDGLMDIIAVDMLPEDHYRRMLMYGPNQYDRFYYSVNHGYSYQYMRNTLQLNNGNGSFSEIGQLAGIYKTGWSWSALLADYDNDSHQDIFITNGFGKDVTDLDFVKFRREALTTMDAPSQKKAFSDSLAVRSGIHIPNYAYKNNGDFTFSKVTDDWGFSIPSYSNGAAYADLDRDGDLDLVVNNIDAKAFVYRNNLIEQKTPNSNYLRIKLHGSENNKSGVGSKIRIVYNGKIQVRFLSTPRGFESSVEDYLHVGLGSYTTVDTVSVVWSDGRLSNSFNIQTNQVLHIDHKHSQPSLKTNSKFDQPIFETLPEATIPYRHVENDFMDYRLQPLLLHKLSQEGPGITVGDINGDGLDDMYVGGSYRQPRSILIQTKNKTFKNISFDTDDFPSEDAGCLLFDADNDHDLDLYVVSGGNEYSEGNIRYQDRLYINDGKGNFKKNIQALPSMLTSGSCVVSGDYDLDGDLDLFIGGRATPSKYPVAPTSYILRNDHGKFSDVTEVIAPELKNIGMVTSSVWTDFNNDNQLDLIVAGEAMPITIFKNEKGKFTNVTTQTGLGDTNGFWNSITAGDFDNDGDVDFVAGNFGLNSPYHASVKEPMTIHHADFDNNGSVEPIVSCYEDGISYPVSSLDVITQQVPSLKKHILYYRTFAATTTEQLLKMTGKKDISLLTIKTLHSTYFENKGYGTFATKVLPLEAQLGPLYGMLAEDINGDGNLDLLAVGNSYATEVITGRYDALKGITLLGDGKNNFTHLSVIKSGFFVDGDGKSIARLNLGKEKVIVVTQNNDSVKGFRYLKKNSSPKH